MACEDKNNNDVSCNKSKVNYKKKSSSVKPRNSEYNLPSILTDFTKSPHRIYQRGNLLGTGGFAKVFQVQDESTGVYYVDQASNRLNSLLKRYESMSENSQLSSGSKEDPLNNDIS